MIKKRYLFLLPSVLLLLTTSFFYYSYAVNLPNSSQKETVTLVIEPGSSVDKIAKQLEEAGLIRSAALFRLYVVLNDLAAKLQAGEYTLARNLNVKEVAAALSHGTFEDKITFIEGWRREEYAEAIDRFNSELKKQGLKINGAEFLRESEGLEGYLFPDTYFITPQTTTRELVEMMRDNFDRKIKTLENRSGLSLKEAVIIASIVEREVRHPEDRPIVAGILIKRLQNGWSLQADATIQYALGYQSNDKTWWKPNLTKADLKIDSPFNTYLQSGLPPAPICNPGLDSLKAVFNPKETDYWYYLSDRKGNIHYARTNEEHNRNIARYLR